MSGNSSLRLLSARPNEVRNSALVEEVLRLLRNGLAHGSEQVVLSQCSAWMGREEAAKQIRTLHRLSADVLLRLAGAAEPEVADEALNVYLAPIGRGVCRLAAEPTEDEPLDALARVMAEVGDVARAVALACADRRIAAEERTRIMAETREARAALDRLDAIVLGGVA